MPKGKSRFQMPAEDPNAPPPLKFPERRFSPIRNIGVRILIAVSALLITTTLVWVEGDCYRDLDQIGALTWIDALYYASVTLSTTGYGDITPVCESARLVNVLIITPLRFLFLIVLVGTTIEVLTQRTREQVRSRRWRNNVNDHTVIIGYGVKGRAAAKSLVDAGTDRHDIVVVATDRGEVDEATRDGFVGVVGDGRRENVLRDAAIERAKRIVVATNEDDTSILVTLTARRLSPHATIVAAVREAQNLEILRQSGANNVIPTAESAGRLMGLSLLSSTAGEIMEDLLDSGRGLEVVEREITREEMGLSPADLDASGQIVLAVIRNGVAHRFDTNDINRLEPGDRLVVIRHNPPERS
jgi:voltage-gated potassium channel